MSRHLCGFKTVREHVDYARKNNHLLVAFLRGETEWFGDDAIRFVRDLHMQWARELRAELANRRGAQLDLFRAVSHG